jgi:hypothetical protein
VRALRLCKALGKLARLGAPAVRRGLQFGKRRGLIVSGATDQCAVVMDHPLIRSSRSCLERHAEISLGLGMTARGKVKNAAVQCRTGKLTATLECPRVIANRLLVPAQ